MLLVEDDGDTQRAIMVVMGTRERGVGAPSRGRGQRDPTVKVFVAHAPLQVPPLFTACTISH